MAQLAEEFPGSLREMDTLPLEIITGRIRALCSAERDSRNVEAWMGAQALFHRLARGALAAKRWLRGSRRITVSRRASFQEALPTMPRGADAALFLGELERIAAPPRGRLMDVVHAKLAEMLGVTNLEARELVLRRHGPATQGQATANANPASLAVRRRTRPQELEVPPLEVPPLLEEEPAPDEEAPSALGAALVALVSDEVPLEPSDLASDPFFGADE